VNTALTYAAKGMHGVMDVTSRKMVSIDFNHDPHSMIVAPYQTDVQQGNLLRVFA
jgi:glyceraldehyde 3-phosphate dehydrogenase